MKLMFLFFTQSEGGAPGYLSRKGEETASALADSFEQFFEGSLGLTLKEGFEARATSLGEDIRWKAFRYQDSFSQAVAASLRLYPHALLVSGGALRSLKTSESIASQMALPVCVDERLDRTSVDKPQKGTCDDAMMELTRTLRGVDAAQQLKLVMCGTSVEALSEWAKEKIPLEKQDDFIRTLHHATSAASVPTILACGLELGPDGKESWIFDL